MGQHRSETGARGVSRGPVIALGLIVLIVLGALGWFKLGDRINDQGVAAAGTCVEGDAVLAVAADPDIAPQIQVLADRYTETKPVIRDHCVSVIVTQVASSTVRDALDTGPDGPWDAVKLGPRPALWIPISSHAIHQLRANGVVSGEPRSIATSPVVLAGRTELADALTKASTSWRDLPSLQAGQDSLGPLGLSGWGGLKLASPLGPDSATTDMAVEAVAAGVGGSTTGPVTEDMARSAPVVSALRALSSASTTPTSGNPTTTRDALAVVATQQDPATAAVHAVATTEQQVYRALRDSPGSGITAFLPKGATPVADHPAAILAGSAVDETQSRAAAQFVDFVRKPEQSQVLAEAGFRVENQSHPTNTALTFPDLGPALVPADGAAAAELMRVVENPVTDRTATILLDLSSSMGTSEGATTRLASTTAALSAQIDRSPDTANLGLWEFGTNLDGARPYVIVVATGPLSGGGFAAGTRRQAFDAAFAKAKATGGSATFTSLAATYKSAVAGYTPGRTNSVLLITDGADDASSLGRAGLVSAISDSFDSSRPVRIDIVTTGQNPDLDTFQSVADRTGGSLEKISSFDEAALSSAIGTLLS